MWVVRMTYSPPLSLHTGPPPPLLGAPDRGLIHALTVTVTHTHTTVAVAVTVTVVVVVVVVCRVWAARTVK